MIGGNSGINKRIDVMETEVYSPDFDQWTMVAQLSMGQSEAGACLVNDRIFIVGGYCWSARRCIKVIQVNKTRNCCFVLQATELWLQATELCSQATELCLQASELCLQATGLLLQANKLWL